MTAGVGKSWGQTLYYQNYENASDASSWTAGNITPELDTNDANYGNYISLNQSNGGGYRTAYTSFFLTGNNIYGSLTSYTIEFDAAITKNSDSGYHNELVLYGEGQAMPAGNASYGGTNHVFRLFSKSNTTTGYYVERNSGTTFSLDNGTWYHYKIKVDRSTRTVTYTIGVNTGSYTLTDGISTDVQGILAVLGRYNSIVNIDNIHVYGLFTYYLVSDNPTWTLIKEGLAAEGSSATAHYPQYELRGTTLYEAGKNSNQYSKTFTVTQNYQQETVPYTQSTIPNVVFYSEGENIEGASIGTDLPRASNGYLGHTGGTDNFVDVKQLAPGTYTLHYTANNNNSANRNCIFRIGNYDLFNHTIEGNTRWQYHEKDFTVSESSMLSFAFNGHNGSGVDWVYITATGLAFQEASGTYVKGTSNQKPTLINTTGETATFTSSNTNIVEVSSDGTLTLKDYGQAVITAIAGGYTTTHKVTVAADTDAAVSFTFDPSTHTETFTVSGTGNIAEHFEGQRITFDIGNPDETQYVDQGSLYCIDANGYTFIYLPGDIPTMGSYYAFTPTVSGRLSLYCATNARQGIRLADASGTVLEKITAEANDWQWRTFTAKLEAGQTYYVYAEVGWIADPTTDQTATLFLNSFVFDATQSENRTINVSDLLYATVDGGINSTANKLDRTIPGLQLTFSGGDGTTVYNSDRITFHQNSSGVGQLDITPRLYGSATENDIVFTNVTLNYTAIESGKATSALVNGTSVAMGVGSTSVTATLPANTHNVTIRYGSDSDNNSFVLTSLTLSYAVTGQQAMEEVLDMSKTATQVGFENSEFAVAAGHPKTQAAIFVTPIAPQAYSYGDGFTAPVTYSSDDTGIATVNASTGEVTMLATTLGAETTITANFAGTDYFLPSSGSYTVKSSVDANNYTIEHVKRGMVIEVDMTSDGAAQLNFTNTIANTQQVNSSETIVVSTYAFDNNGSNDEFQVVIKTVSGTAYIHGSRAYYRKPELKLNYAPEAVYNHHPNWTDGTLASHFANNQGIASCFDVTGEPVFTAYFEGTDLTADFIPDASTYTIASGNIQFVIDPATTPKGTIRSTGNASTITDAQVTIPVTLRSSALGYDPTDANNTATANIAVIPFPYTWDLTTGINNTKYKALQLENVNDAGSSLTLTHGSVMVESIGNLGKTAYNYYIDPSLPESRLRIPVMQGMKVSITSSGTQNRVVGNGYPLQITNATDLRGYATATIDILTESNTQHFLAKDDGYMEIYNRSDVDVSITSITVTAPELEFEDGNDPYVSWSATYQNRVINKPTKATLSFSHNGNTTTQVSNMTADGTFTFVDNAAGTVTVTATTGATAKNLEPCWGQYTIHLEDFYFSPREYTLYTTGTTTLTATQMLTACNLYIGDKQWVGNSNVISEEDKMNISFSIRAPSTYTISNTTYQNYAKALLQETGDVDNPYTVEIRNNGQLIITAVYRRDNSLSTVKATCTLTVVTTQFSGFEYPAPIVASDQTTYTFGEAISENRLSQAILSQSPTYECYYIGKRNPDDDNGNGKQQVTVTSSTVNNTPNIPTISLTNGPGVYRVQAKVGGDVVATFYLTKAYPVDENTSQSWLFGGYLNSSNVRKTTLHDENGTAIDLTDNSKWLVGMPTNRSADYRYTSEVNGSNGFIIQETAGLQIIANAPTCDPLVGTVTNDTKSRYWCGNSDGHFSAFSGAGGNYANVGIHKSTLIIPQLPKGAYVAVAWDRTVSGQGSTIIMENLLDLEGKAIDVISYGGSVRLSGESAGINQGFYTFRVAEDGNVVFTQDDSGTSRIVAIHVYYGNRDTSVPASDDVYYNRNATQRFKGSGMSQQLMAYATANADGTANTGSGVKALSGILTVNGKATSQWLTNYLNFGAPNGAPEFQMVNQDETLHAMTMDLSQTYFDSGNGRYNVPGLTFNGACWGKAIMSVGVRDERGYLVAYRQYRFTVGVKPYMSYPKTWDFTRYFDNSTVKIEDSPVTVQPNTANLDTKASLARNTSYVKTTLTDDPNVEDTDPTRTWDTGNTLMRKSGDETYLQYGYNEYASYYVDDAMLVCNLGERNDKGFILEETRGLGFNIAKTDNSLQWEMPDDGTGVTVGYAANSTLKVNGTITIAAVGDEYKGYYVFLKSSRVPDDYSTNLRRVTSGDYQNIVDNGQGQYIFEVTSAEDMTMTFTADTEIYGIGVTNIQKDALHPVGGIGWATESRRTDIDHTLTGYYTRHPVRVYEVKYDSYDMNTATVMLSEVKNTVELTDAGGTVFYDHGYVKQETGVVLAERNCTETSPYKIPLFVPAITTTHPAYVSDQNMMRPSIERKRYDSETETENATEYTRFLLTNVHWTYDSSHTLNADEAAGAKYADAAGFYRHHVWETTADRDAKNIMAANQAYLLVPTANLPTAVWELQSTSSSAPSIRNSIAIRFGDLPDNDDTTGIVQGASTAPAPTDGWYTLSGMKLADKPKKAGLYIHNGRKILLSPYDFGNNIE